jgi:hypothetical protein
VTVKAYPDRVCLYVDNQLIARHARRYGRHEDIEEPDHAKGLIAQRSRAREQRLMMHFLALSPDAQAYYDGLEQRRLNARQHVRKILRADLGNAPRIILQELGAVSSTNVILPTATAPQRDPRLRCVIQPDRAQAALLDRLDIQLPERLRIRFA